ncbi:Uncharacterised protein [uncultured Comamonas sp.]|nr:Uncharacterised protein [uncultured Comamonas sp.]
MTDGELTAEPLTSEMEVAVTLARTLREQQTLLQSTDIGVAFIQKREVLRCNDRFAQIFGYDDAQAIVGEASYALHPSREAFRALGRDAFADLAQGGTFRSVRQMRKSDGRLFWASLTGRLINPVEPSEGSIWTLDDVDAHIHMRSQLDAIQLQTQVLLDHAMVGVAYLRDHAVVRCNRHVESMLGYGAGELQGCSSRTWFADDDQWHAQRARCASVLAAGEVFAAEMALRRKDGAPLICEVRSKALQDGCAVWILMDITERRQAQEALREAHAELERVVSERTHALVTTAKDLDKEIQERKYDQERIYRLAHYDVLTGLPNRTLLAERSQQAIASAQMQHTPLAVLFLDLDHFKHVNDSLGHKVGDHLLARIAQRLRQTVREYDTVARLGGDEFVLLLPRANAQGAQRVAGKVAQAFDQPFHIGQHELTLGCSVGVALYPQDGRDFDALVQSADMAMYGAKREGRNTYRFFTSQMQAQSMRALELENALRRALERDQLSLHYQPQVDAATGKVVGVEALLRWQHPELGMVSPTEFIPVAESSGLIWPIGQWVLETAAHQLNAWRSKGLLHITMAVNLSARQFHQPQLPDLVRDVLQQADVPPQCFELELTESAAMSDVPAAEQTLAELQKLGVRLSIDDFGTGYASLTQLKRLPSYKLKIDQSFVRDLDKGDTDKAMVNAIVRMAQAMGLRITAEGVETQDQLDFLQTLGCDEAQGYYFSRPKPAAEIESFLFQRAV